MPATVTKEQSDSYSINNHGEYAQIFIKHGCANEKRYSCAVSIISSYGNWGYHWSHMGLPYNEFLTKISIDYAMNKFARSDYMVFDLHKTIEECRRYLLDNERGDVVGDLNSLNEIEAENPQSEREFYTMLSDKDIYFDDAPIVQMENHQCKAFWNNIWKPFIAELTATTTATE